MSAVAALISLAAGGAFLASGYLFGAKKGVAARVGLAADSARKDETIHELEGKLLTRTLAEASRGEGAALKSELLSALQPLVSRKDGDVGELRQEIRVLMKNMNDRERQGDSLKEEIRVALANLGDRASDPEKLQAALQKMLVPVLRREEENRGLKNMMREVLAPMVERDRLGKEFSKLESGSGLGELPKMLDAIAEGGGFSTVVLSDDLGLPIAANSAATGIELHAGFASYLQTLNERAERSGSPRPTAVVIQDESNQLALHRFFVVDGNRFTVTALTRGMYLAPSALDPALAKLEGALARKEWS